MVRAAVKRRLVAILDAALTDVSVTYTWDGQPTVDNTLYLGVAEGRFDPESIGFHEPLSVDEWTINAEMWMHGFRTGSDAEEAVEARLRVVRTTLLSARRLHIDGDGGPHPESYRGVRTVRLGQVDGPHHTFPQPNSGSSISGTVGFALDCTADL